MGPQAGLPQQPHGRQYQERYDGRHATCLHFRDKAKIDDDGYFKVWPIFANLNKAGHWFVDEGQFSVDEVMIPYFGRHSSKQFIHGKPIRYGFKVWALCTSGGSGVWFNPYCGRDTWVEDMGLGQGPNVVLQLLEKASLLPGSELFFDNLFTSFPLLDNLSARNIAGAETVRQNKEKISFKIVFEIQKKAQIFN